MLPSDACRESVETFNKLAERYAAKYFDLTQYDRYYAMLAERLPFGGSVIDVACGPGTVSAYLKRARPDLSVVGTDLAPRMIDEARQRVPGGVFHVSDCRDLEGFDSDAFEGAVFAFGLSYLTDLDAQRCFAALVRRLKSGAPLLLATITGPSASRYEQSSSGERVFMVYRTPDAVHALLQAAGFRIVFSELIASPENAALATTDLLVLAVRVATQAPSNVTCGAGEPCAVKSPASDNLEP
ncbi:class I SAM-dependent methyltransferase [Niveibacterium sp.]|uniref:class I SAM-dependent DNA methyltransferase n=1 Tax=Niveibacterium sp. TaxID=2017444 RepID=UPI0035B1F73C